MQQQESSTAFTTELEAWRQELVALEAALTLLLSVQKLWLHLEPVFSAGDVSKQLPTEGQLFQTVDDEDSVDDEQFWGPPNADDDPIEEFE